MNVVKVNFKKPTVEKTSYEMRQEEINEQVTIRMKRIREILDELKEIPHE